jgi:hypothetical protein
MLAPLVDWVDPPGGAGGGRQQAQTDYVSAASHIKSLLAGDVDNNSRSSSSSSSSVAVSPQQVERVLMVCFRRHAEDQQHDVQLYQAVAAAVPVLPPNRHLFRGSWQELKTAGVELWPAPVAARLQQLLGG